MNFIFNTKKAVVTRFIIGILAVSLLFSLVSCMPRRAKKPEDASQPVYGMYYDSYSDFVEKKFEMRGIIYYVLYNYEIDYESTNATVEDYKQVAHYGVDYLPGYYSLLGYEETDKVLQALGYEGWDDYLIKSGYVDEDGNPDFYTWSVGQNPKGPILESPEDT